VAFTIPISQNTTPTAQDNPNVRTLVMSLSQARRLTPSRSTKHERGGAIIDRE
jgi:hypothetical protein